MKNKQPPVVDDNRQLWRGKPLVSIVMPVRNGEKYLPQAIDSLVQQTYRQWELVVVNDNSKDNTLSILKKYAKKYNRIFVYSTKRRVGISRALELGLKKAKGDFIARMDADDICLPERLAKQVSYLKRRSDVVAIGAQCYVINAKGKHIGKKKFPLTYPEIYDFAFKFNPVQHPTLMFVRSRLPEDFEYYHDSFDGAEDLDLLFKLFRYGRVENMNQYLLKYRIHQLNSSLIDVKDNFRQALLARVKAVRKYNYQPSFSGLIVTLAQFFIVSFLPAKFIYRLYFVMRKIKSEAESVEKAVKKQALKPRFAFSS